MAKCQNDFVSNHANGRMAVPHLEMEKNVSILFILFSLVRIYREKHYTPKTNKNQLCFSMENK